MSISGNSVFSCFRSEGCSAGRIHWNRQHHAFSLVEILVVIAILAILAVLLFPSGRAMLDAAQGWKCISKQRTLASAILAYSGENGGKFPVSYARVLLETGGGYTETWYFEVEPYMGESAKKFFKWMTCTQATQEEISNGITIGVHSGRPGNTQSGALVQGDNVTRKHRAMIPGSTALTGCTRNNVGTYLNPLGWKFTADTDDDDILDSRNPNAQYNGLTFRHGGRAGITLVDGSAKLIRPKEWAENEGNIWGELPD